MANITRHDPFSEMDDFFKGFFLRPVRMELADTPTLGQIKVDVSEDESTYRVHAEVPGAKKEDIKVSIDGDVVSISAEVKRNAEQKEGERLVRSERYHGTVSRAFSLGADIDESKCEAKYQDGVLELVLAKKAGGRARKITVN
jgi:HSP20 family protein